MEFSKVYKCNRRLEDLNEHLTGSRQRAKVSQEERDALEAKKAVAEAYLKKERERLVAEATLATVFIYDGKVRFGRAIGVGLPHI